tara:strand:+ start:1296 stop:1568 length:273 start_codon:yes stop_codon:yes gene_type:complete
MAEEVNNDAVVEGSANAPELNVQDIINTIKIIDVVSGRGAVKGDELSSVGRVRDRLVAFVNAMQPPVPEGAEDAAPPSDEGDAEIVEEEV